MTYYIATLLALLALVSSPSFAAPSSVSYYQGRSADVVSCSTYLGSISGKNLGNGSIRFTLPYAQPPVGNLRFANPQPIPKLGNRDVKLTPPSCYQPGLDARGGNAMSEDCLYNTYYMPTGTKPTDRLPLLVWIHGGSGIAGTSTAAGLDGSKIASSQHAIVVILQYRLGLFGWLQTASILDEINGGQAGQSTVAGNQAMRDVIMALQQIKTIATSIGGDADKVSITGQSSGASMVRALLTTPSAKGLFSSAVLVSDPVNYGLSSIADNNALGEFAMKQLSCLPADIKCARKASPNAIAAATLTTYSEAPYSIPGIASGTPWRAMKGKDISTSTEQGGKATIPVLMTTVANEAGSIISSLFTASKVDDVTLTYVGDGAEKCTLNDALSTLFDQSRAGVLSGTLDSNSGNLADGLRSSLENTVTDGLWRCATQFNAVRLSQSASRVWLAQWNIGSTYPSNSNSDYCKNNSRVCHEDDIYTIFGTSPNPTAALTQLSNDWQSRLVAFARSSQPNVNTLPYWAPVQSANQLNLLSMGTPGIPSSVTTSFQNAQRLQTCTKIWGSSVKYDWQLYESR